MVDIGKKKGGKDGKDDSSDSKKKKRDSVKDTGGSGSSSGGANMSPDDVDTDPFEMDSDFSAEYDGASVASTSERLSSEGAELNYHAENGEGEREYVKRQVDECKEFYDDYVENALDNLTDINEFTLIHHALLISLARNRIGIADVLMDRFGYSESEAVEKADTITQKAGESEAMLEVLSEMTEAMMGEE